MPARRASRPNASTVRPERLAAIRSLCLALPEAVEKTTWGDPTWRVREKIFAMQKGNYDGGRPSLWVKAAEGVQERLVRARPARFFVPPYVGHAGWVGLYLDGDDLCREEVEGLVRESYRRIAPKRLRALLAE